jgi:hypothetical protein
MSYKDTKLPFTTERDEKKVNYVTDSKLCDLHTTLKNECFKFSVDPDINTKQLAKIELVIEFIKDKLEISTYDYKCKLVDKL